MSRNDLTAQSLRELLHYEPATGVFTWHVSKGTSATGDIAGYGKDMGYLRITIKGVKHLAHRLAWLYVHGVWPTSRIDHIDHDPSNNRLNNLRDVSCSINMQNQRQAMSNSASGFLGTYPRGNKFRAQIRFAGKKINLGTFSTPELAHAAYLIAKRKFHDGCTI